MNNARSETTATAATSDKDLKVSIQEGVSSSFMLGAGESYLSAFGIHLQASALQIGVLSAFPSLAVALAQNLGVFLMERLHQRRILCQLSAFGQVGVWIGLAAIAAFSPPGASWAVPLLIGLSAVYFVFAGITGPVWNSMMGDVVPSATRGRFFGARSRRCGIATFAGLTTAGALLDYASDHQLGGWGFAAIFLLAAGARLTAGFLFGRHRDPPFQLTEEDKFTFLQFVKRAPRSNFAKFVFFVASLNCAVNIAGPYFAVYILEELKFSYWEFTLIGIATVVAQFLTLHHWGALSDRFGNKKILNISAVGIALSPVAWVLHNEPWYFIIVQALTGFLWAGFNLAMGNFVFDAVTPAKRGRCAAYLAFTNGIFTFVGGIAGGVYLSQFAGAVTPHFAGSFLINPYFQIFLLSAVLRLLATEIFLHRITEVRPVEPIRHYDLIIEIVQLRPFTGATFRLFSRLRQP